ncbi:MAG: hypothetical protein QXH73_06155 [Ignisphaera sp.]
MDGISKLLIEQQIVDVLEHANYRVQILRSSGFAKEADKEFATAILTALLLSRAYCSYHYLDQDTCIELNNLLGYTLAVYIATYRVRVDEELENLWTYIQSLWTQKEAAISIPS